METFGDSLVCKPAHIKKNFTFVSEKRISTNLEQLLPGGPALIIFNPIEITKSLGFEFLSEINETGSASHLS